MDSRSGILVSTLGERELTLSSTRSTLGLLVDLLEQSHISMADTTLEEAGTFSSPRRRHLMPSMEEYYRAFPSPEHEPEFAVSTQSFSQLKQSNVELEEYPRKIMEPSKQSQQSRHAGIAIHLLPRPPEQNP